MNHTSGVLSDGEMRLRPVRIHQDIPLARAWYRDWDVLYYSEGPSTPPYDDEMLLRMYTTLSQQGELYIVEVSTAAAGWCAIGDAWLSREDLALVIGDPLYRSRGLGKRVVNLLVARALQLHWPSVRVGKVYTYNDRSRRLFESLGFALSGGGVENDGTSFWQFILPLATSQQSPE